MIDFQQQVIDKSFDQPVIVDFWASWCGPCQTLGPIIEQIAEEQKEQWTLVKLSTEEQADIATQYNVKSIPNVKLFHKGQVIAEFAGALPRTSILKWLEENLPSEARSNFENILQRLSEKDPLAIQELRNFVEVHPEMREARLTLAQNIIFTEPATAQQLIEDFALGYTFYDEANYLKDLARFLAHQADDTPVGKKISAAQLAASNQDIEASIQFIIEAVSIHKDYADALPRKTGVALFRTLGTDHPLTKTYRWKFDMSLY